STMNGYLYRCLITCCSNVLTSNAATLNLIAPVMLSGGISGNSTPVLNSTQTYTIQAANAATYTWDAGTGNTIISGQGTHTVTVLIGAWSGNISVTVAGPNGCSTETAMLPYVATPPVFVGVNLKVLLEGPYNTSTGLMNAT